MRDIWYSDNRDIVKWGTLIHLAKQEKISHILQVPFWRPEKDYPDGKLEMDDGNTPKFAIHRTVWEFFRNVSDIEKLSSKEDIQVNINVLKDEFIPTERGAYLRRIVESIVSSGHPMILFLDPDTGLAPRTVKPEHVTKDEIKTVWDSLREGDWLVLYQHARRQSDWKTKVWTELREICGDAEIQVATAEKIARDVALFCMKKGRSAKAIFE